MKAYILLDTEIGYEKQVVDQLEGVHGIKNRFMVYGIHDVIVELETESMEELKKLVVDSIRPLKYVKNTVTLTTY